MSTSTTHAPEFWDHRGRAKHRCSKSSQVCADRRRQVFVSTTVCSKTQSKIIRYRCGLEKSATFRRTIYSSHIFPFDETSFMESTASQNARHSLLSTLS